MPESAALAFRGNNIIQRRRSMLEIPQKSKSRQNGLKIRLACLIAVSFFCWPSFAQNASEKQQKAVAEISAAEIASAQQFGQSLGFADWMGPLAPVALSPFFGIACLSGMAIYGQGWVSADNAFLGEASPLNNHAVFWAFLIMTLVTSLPRLTKVSKPFAQAVDQVEAWAGIITMVTLKIMLGAKAPEAAEIGVIQLGILSFTIDTLMMIAAAINIFVINTVKFFFEVLIWITQVPTIDAIFEFTNKAVCGMLMAIYGYSPTIATGINLGIFIVAAIVFRWSYRREVFFRTMLIDALWAVLSPPTTIGTEKLTVFPTAAIGAIPAKARCQLSKSESGWTLTQQQLLRGNVQQLLSANECRMELDAGYFTNSLKLSGSHSVELTFSRWYNRCLPELADSLNATLNAADAKTLQGRAGLKAEMSS